jgi:PAS domain S-box-containing protein
VTNTKGEILEVNDMFCEVSGYSEEYLLGQDHRILNSGYHPRKFWRKMWADLKKGHSWREEVCNRKKNGALYWTDSVMNPVYAKNGKLHQILSIRYLITKRKQAEEEVNQQQIMLREAEVLANTGTWSYNTATSEFKTSEGLKKMLWSTPKPTVSLTEFLNTPIPEDQEVVKLSLKKAIYEAEYTYRFRVALWYEETGETMLRYIKAITKVSTVNGDITKLLTTCQDITADFLDKKAIQESKTQVEYLLESTNSSIRYAKRIQQALLPTKEYIKKHLDFFLLYKPRDIVSGDFYWFEKNNRALFLAVGDCTGHGVPGAFMTMLGVSAIQEALRHEHLTSPSGILQRIHSFIHSALRQEYTENQDGMDLAVCVIPTKNTTTIAYAGANLPLYYVEPSTEIDQPAAFHKVQPDRKGIGGHNKRETNQSRLFKTQIIHTKAKTTFFLCSDGYQDQFGGQRSKKFMRRRLELQLYENAYLPLEKQKEIHEQKIEGWMEGHNQVDDITLFGFRPIEE